MIVNQKAEEFINQEQFNKLFWFGFILYSITYLVYQISPIRFGYTVPAAIQSLGLVFIFYASLNIIKWKFENSNLEVIFLIYMLWLIIIILRGFTFDFQFIVKMLFNLGYGIMPYLVPLILLFPRKISFYKQLFSVIIIFGFIYLILNILFGRNFFIWDRRSIELQGFIEQTSLLSVPSGFILLTYKYHSFRTKIFSFFVIAVGLLIAIYGARRNLIFIYSTQLMFSFLLYLIQSHRRILLIIYSVFFLVFMLYYLNSALLKNDNPFFSYLVERALQDTRTGVELAFYADFNLSDWIIGRGISGTYYCPGIEDGVIYRYVIETGYLHMILKGGIISLLLNLIIAIPSIFLGLFYSNNLLTKAAGIWIILWIFYLYPTIMEAFSLYYIIFWITIGICYTKRIRLMTDIQIHEHLHFVNNPDRRVLFDY